MFTESVILSDAPVSKMIVFIRGALSGSNGTLLLGYQMLAAVKHAADDNFVFQHNYEPAHWACDTV